MLKTNHKLRFKNGTKGVRNVRPKPSQPEAPAKIPHISRLMALAIHCDELIQTGAVADQADLAALAHVTRARISQIMNLLCLAPDIQESILFFESQESGRQPINEPKTRKLSVELNWERQRKMLNLGGTDEKPNYQSTVAEQKLQS